MDRVTEFIKRLEKLEDLVGTTEPVMPQASDKGDGGAEARSISEAEHLSRRLSQVQDFLTKIKGVVLKVVSAQPVGQIGQVPYHF